MTSQQRDLILPLLLSLAGVKTMQQLDAIWTAITISFRAAGLDPGRKPTSLPQAHTLAVSLRKRVIGAVR